MSTFSISILFLLGSGLTGQVPSGRPVHPGAKPSPASEADAKPVTAREVRESFVRTIGLMEKVRGSSLGKPALPAADRPATRAEIVGEMNRLFRAAQPGFFFTPAPVAHDASVFRIDAAQKSALDKLVTLGFVAKIGPLAVGPQPGLTTKQFGDALGFFMARASQLSHLPNSRWTPMLQGPEGSKGGG